MSIGDQYQADLCDMSRFSKYNDDMKFLLTCIDCFSKFAWVLPIKNKTSQEIVRVLKIIFSKKVCKRLQTDKGAEFLNANVRTLLKKNGVELWLSENEDVKDFYRKGIMNNDSIPKTIDEVMKKLGEKFGKNPKQNWDEVF